MGFLNGGLPSVLWVHVHYLFLDVPHGDTALGAGGEVLSTTFPALVQSVTKQILRLGLSELLLHTREETLHQLATDFILSLIFLFVVYLSEDAMLCAPSHQAGVGLSFVFHNETFGRSGNFCRVSDDLNILDLLAEEE